MNPTRLLGSLALVAALIPPAARAQSFTGLSPANVIGGSPVFFNNAYNDGASAYTAGNIFNQQAGVVDMSSQPFNAWFPSEAHGVTDRFLTIDLGTPTVLSGIEIFNSNQADRGTLHFSLSAGHSVSDGGSDGGIAVGNVVNSPVVLLGSTALTYSTANPVTGQFFALSDPTAYRYLSLLLIDGQAQSAFAGVGLAEVRLSGTAVPEPSDYALVTGAALLGFVVWRRRQSR